jgi:hypothetical protein
MKNLKSAKYHLLTAVFSLVFMTVAISGYGASITFMLGDVKVSRGGKTITAELDKKLLAGDMIKTGKDGIATVKYDDGSEIKIQENSWVKIGDKAAEDKEFVSVVSGVIKAKFSKVSKQEERKVYTPTTVCSVRGTEFMVGVSEGADTQVALTEGKLDVGNPYGTTQIKENQKVEIDVAKAPEAQKGFDLSMDDLLNWKKSSDAEFEKNPEAKTDSFNDYINTLNKRSQDSTKQISGLEKKNEDASRLEKKDIENASQEANKIESTVADDMFLCSTTGSSIDGILNKYQKDKKEMYDKYLKIKAESNKVQEQLKKNYEAIMAVKAAYKKAYDEIMGKNKSYMDKIKGGIDKEKVKPQKQDKQ